MRLIDADKLLERASKTTVSGGDYAVRSAIADALGKVISKLVNEEPIAFDVDKVVEELEASGRKMSESKIPHKYYKAVSVKKAIEIVEKAGAE